MQQEVFEALIWNEVRREQNMYIFEELFFFFFQHKTTSMKFNHRATASGLFLNELIWTLTSVVPSRTSTLTLLNKGNNYKAQSNWCHPAVLSNTFWFQTQWQWRSRRQMALAWLAWLAWLAAELRQLIRLELGDLMIPKTGSVDSWERVFTSATSPYHEVNDTSTLQSTRDVTHSLF